MIVIRVEPRADRLYDIHVDVPGNQLLNSDQGYARALDAEAAVRRLWPPIRAPRWVRLFKGYEPIELRVTYLDGTQKVERLR